MQRKALNYGVLFVVILLTASLSCQAISDIFEDEYDDKYDYHYEGEYEESESESAPPPAEYENPASSVTCPAITENILTVATQIQEEFEDEQPENQDNQYLVTYQVTGNEISNPLYEDVPENLINYQNDTVNHQQMWEYFVTLIPADERTELEEFMIVTDGEGNGLAAVAQTTYDPNLWSIEVDIIDADNKLDLTYTLIHEYAHLLTLGPDQVTPSIAVFNNPDNEDIYLDEAAACPEYFPGEGCSQADSYINVFFNQFWADIHEEWQEINLIEDDEAYYEALDNFYYDYEDRFLTEYATTNPEEDIAEAFTFFVLSPRPSGNTIAEEKILFFYHYPELVQLRDEIINGICSLNP